MRLKKWLCSPWMLLLLGAGILLAMADRGTYRQEGISMTAVEGSVTSRSVTVGVLNRTDRRISNAGELEDYHVQRRLWGLWLPMREEGRPGDTVCAALESCSYEKDVPRRLTFYWSDTRPFDALRPGRYRLVLEFWDHGGESPFALAAEFTVD